MSDNESEPENVPSDASKSSDDEELVEHAQVEESQGEESNKKSDGESETHAIEDSDEEEPVAEKSSDSNKIMQDDDEESEEEMIIHRKKKIKRKRDDDETSSNEDNADQKDEDSSKDDDNDDNEDEDSENEDDDEYVSRTKKVKNTIDDDEEASDQEDEEQEASGIQHKEGDDDNKETSEQEDDEEDDDDEKDHHHSSQNNTIYDFDIMMAKKKEENSKKRRRRNYDIINDNDDIIADIINQMKDAVEADSEANKKKMAATKKLKLLPYVINQLRKVDLRDAFLDSDVLSVITEWLAPLPDKSLPHLNIRENLLKILIDFNLYDVERIKASGIGKAIMYLYKHPKETKENKLRAKQLISCWSRPIFQLDSSFNSISKEEREQRDKEMMRKQRRASGQDSPEGDRAGPSSANKRKEEGAQKPGDKGWIPRARVPAPSMRDYVIRPQSKVDGDVGKSSRRPANMLEKYMKNQQERRRANRQQRAINMKIDRV